MQNTGHFYFDNHHYQGSFARHLPQNKICFRNIMFTKHNNIENFQHNIEIMLQRLTEYFMGLPKDGGELFWIRRKNLTK